MNKEFDLKAFYDQCSSGENVDCTGVFEYLKSYKNVIIWGCSHLGKAVGNKLLEVGVPITVYWDERFQELGMYKNIRIEKPFSVEYDRENTVILYSIGNQVLLGGLLFELKKNGYQNVVRGDIFYSGAICKFKNGMSLTSEQCWGSMECRPLICQRARKITEAYSKEEKPGERIDLTYVAFVINSICNLDCKYCVQYVNNYPPKTRGHVQFEQISRDIDTFFDTIDSTGAITVMGGETFLHPDISKIIAKLCTKKNFGFISVASNGLVEIKPEQLEGFTDPRVAVNFGYYLHVATEKQKEIYYKNVELVKSRGITCTESVQLPMWVIPSTLYKLDVDREYMINRKKNCLMPPRDLQIKNGKVHVCDMSLALHNMEVADFPTDYADLKQGRNLEEMRNQLRELIDREYYISCGYCRGSAQNAGPGGLQGKWDAFAIDDVEEVEIK